jgi:hypothetical protein
VASLQEGPCAPAAPDLLITGKGSDHRDQAGLISDAGTPEQKLGAMSGYSWEHDPKRLAFTASRYKFVAKMLEGKRSVLEVGCADAFFSRIVRQHVDCLVAVDKSYSYIGSAKKVRSPRWHVYLNSWDILEDGPCAPGGGFDAVYCLDVFEHIEKSREDVLLGNLAKCAPVCIVGCPSAESQLSGLRDLARRARELPDEGGACARDGAALQAGFHVRAKR